MFPYAKPGPELGVVTAMKLGPKAFEKTTESPSASVEYKEKSNVDPAVTKSVGM